MEKALIQAKAGRRHNLAEMAKCSPPPTLSLSKYAPSIQAKYTFLLVLVGKKVKSITEESGFEAIDMQDDGIVKIMANDMATLERAKAIISGLTMVPAAVGDIYRNCEIKSMAPYGAFVEIAHGREGLCHISELSAEWLAKPEDDRAAAGASKVASVDELVLKKKDARRAASGDKPMKSNSKQ
ncbi:hypothetical protein EUTSA_v10022162mg [Eutrema salsugineum]|uniref:S1 motif domain-containing protein n=1 Tax=Eutrema salsugineum TaxID=72664 RepID=V4NSQ5_EUTSA|nr:hypothetical protein EUTSA_v10022162mg [Eutrema salsugineum]